jgi:hypothetical protein
MRAEPRTPRLNDLVHYRSFGTPRGEYSSVCRAALVTAVEPVDEGTRQQAEIETWDYIPHEVHLFVMNPTGSFFNRSWQDEANHRGGTWHYTCEES